MTVLPFSSQDVHWQRLLDDVLADPGAPRLVFQPIVDLARGVVTGYECLARFDTVPYRTPDLWFAAAWRLDVGAQLEARVVERAMAARATLPPGTFLTVNITPSSLLRDAVRQVVAGQDLRRLVFELTEHDAFGDVDELRGALAQLRAQGALIALDDAGSGYAGLQQLLAVRPEIVKLDRSLVADVDQDEAKLALVEMVGVLSDRLDAWLLAEGIETAAELAVFQRLGVPLGQGWLLGRPADGWTAPPAGAVQARAVASGGLGDLVEAGHVCTAGDLPTATAGVLRVPGLAPAGRPVTVLDAERCPVGLLLPLARGDDAAGAYRLVPTALRAGPATEVAELARRMVTRPDGERFDPVVCIDVEGRYVGLVRMERLVTRLSDSA